MNKFWTWEESQIISWLHLTSEDQMGMVGNDIQKARINVGLLVEMHKNEIK